MQRTDIQSLSREGFLYCGGQIPLGCEMRWQLSCQSLVSGYAQYTLLSSRTVNKEG